MCVCVVCAVRGIWCTTREFVREVPSCWLAPGLQEGTRKRARARAREEETQEMVWCRVGSGLSQGPGTQDKVCAEEVGARKFRRFSCVSFTSYIKCLIDHVLGWPATHEEEQEEQEEQEQEGFIC